MLKQYFKRIFEVTKTGDAREESYYSSLEELLKTYADSINKKKIYVRTLPKKTEAGNPDFRIWDGKQNIIGYIEAKKPTEENLGFIEETEQLIRYLKTFPNLILTNFFEFRLYRNGECIDKVLVARPFIIHRLKTVPPVEKEKEFFNLIDQFFAFSLPRKYTAKSLAVELAKRTRFLKDEVIAEELKEEEEKGEGSILNFYKMFQKYLIYGLTKDDFADLYAQTITYGLFAARTRSQNGFNRKLAFDNIPRTIGILRDVFRFISLEDLPPQMEWIIDDISGVLAVADVNQILHKFYHEGKGKDPIVHFYETFLTEYDPEERVKRGVYYTPEPVVSYIVRSLNIILKEYFNREDGFGANSVTVLDPAAGTLTFLAEASKVAIEEFVAKYGEGGKENLIKDHILKNFYAFELMMAPYAIGHLRMSFLLEELGYTLKKEDRFKLYLTNTLEMEKLEQTAFPGMSSIVEESHLAGEVKKQIPILVIFGNPPYSVSSANKSDFIEKEMEIYKEDVRGERNIQPLSDDYIKFIRFAHWKIDQIGNGVIGMITNNSYLSGLIHRGMRKKLLESFNEIYILNLHGNARIGEKCPDGSKDENVFDIMQGVSIALFIKSKKQDGLGRVFYQDVYGLREVKYDFLNHNDIKTIEWEELKLREPHYFFVKKEFLFQDEYNKFKSIPEIFNQYSSGVKTHRDHFVVGFTKREIEQRMRTFTGDLPDELVKQGLDLNETHDFKIKDARDRIKEEDWAKSILPYSYRPFDIRYICYRPELIDRDRMDIMCHFFKENLGLIFPRKTKVFCHGSVTLNVADVAVGGKFSGSETNVAPLYLYPDKDKKNLFSLLETDEKKPNLNPELVKLLTEVYEKEPTPEEIFYYIYGVLYSNIYRKKYAESLKIDFPKVPFTNDYALFIKMGKYGKVLTDLHLMKSKELDTSIAKFPEKGNNQIEKPKYNEEENRVYINDSQYFEGIEKEIWEYQIGGYQVLDKWLKDRKKRTLALEDIKHYCKIATALKKTIEVQKDIDTLYPDIEKKIIEESLE